jgi:DNA polymerase
LNESIRAVRQQLESLSLAGLTHLPRGKPPSPVAARAAAAAAKPIRAPAGESSHPAAGALAVLAAKVRECTRCAELASTRTQTVFGVGNPQARIVFVGEAPGADEDAQGEPFVGRAGQLLNQIITASRLTREEIYICNVLKCRPPGNRTPNDDECANCREYLEGQLAAINPEYIVCWGAVAAKNLLKSTLSIGKLRGKLHEYGRAKVLCTYHPSYLLRNPAAKKDVWNDMQFLMADMGVDLKGKP